MIAVTTGPLPLPPSTKLMSWFEDAQPIFLNASAIPIRRGGLEGAVAPSPSSHAAHAVRLLFDTEFVVCGAR